MSNYSKIKRIVGADGVTTRTEETFSVRRDPQNYFSLYVDGLEELFKSSNSVVELKVFLALCSKAAFNNNVIPINKAEKNIIAKMIQSTFGSVTNALSNLCKKGLLQNDSGNYTIPLKFFWKGDTRTRQGLKNQQSKKVLLGCEQAFFAEAKVAEEQSKAVEESSN